MCLAGDRECGRKETAFVRVIAVRLTSTRVQFSSVQDKIELSSKNGASQNG